MRRPEVAILLTRETTLDHPMPCGTSACPRQVRRCRGDPVPRMQLQEGCRTRLPTLPTRVVTVPTCCRSTLCDTSGGPSPSRRCRDGWWPTLSWPEEH